MVYNAAKKASNQKSDAKYMQLLLKPYKDEGAAIKAAAEDAGQSTQAYILDAVRAKMSASAIEDGDRVRISINGSALDGIRMDGESRAQAAQRIIRAAMEAAKASKE